MLPYNLQQLGLRLGRLANIPALIPASRKRSRWPIPEDQSYSWKDPSTIEDHVSNMDWQLEQVKAPERQPAWRWYADKLFEAGRERLRSNPFEMAQVASSKDPRATMKALEVSPEMYRGMVAEHRARLTEAIRRQQGLLTMKEPEKFDPWQLARNWYGDLRGDMRTRVAALRRGLAGASTTKA